MQLLKIKYTFDLVNHLIGKIMPQLKTEANGFFSKDNKTFVNLDVSKSSPNRKGAVVKIAPIDKNGTLGATVQFRDFEQGYVVTVEKTKEDIDDWFTTEVKKAFYDIPELVRRVAKGHQEHTHILAESVARKLGFRPEPVGKLLTELL